MQLKIAILLIIVSLFGHKVSLNADLVDVVRTQFTDGSGNTSFVNVPLGLVEINTPTASIDPAGDISVWQTGNYSIAGSVRVWNTSGFEQNIIGRIVRNGSDVLQEQVVTLPANAFEDVYFTLDASLLDGDQIRLQLRGTNSTFQYIGSQQRGYINVRGYNQVMAGVLLGDVNLDGLVNLLDVEPFIQRLSDGVFQTEADCNEDGIVNLLDVQPFIDILSGG